MNIAQQTLSNKQKVIQDCMALADGTLASLTGYTLYEKIAKVQKKFVEFSIGVLDSSPNEFKTWCEAWDRFLTVYTPIGMGGKKMSEWCDNPATVQPSAATSTHQKVYYHTSNIGKAKYVINYHDGVSTHKDGSPFFDIHISSNKKKRDDFEKELLKQGYTQRGVSL